ncbi:RCC1/BLIP-II [Pseudovirgaria hyperparasitica]|uniref:RCC1/BLIP-II n=1 Tax=Pseudovirgaria hyperparasitica TaxID=470096 RepID=A0A6A6W4Z5_9PEZI|nr:RCC1/BLIP-II [Pseudovirgaria hyperparasitica]KAF2757249.1 RCC1/BLIP-II [Pseudovirgaria hyperparasitica]
MQKKDAAVATKPSQASRKRTHQESDTDTVQPEVVVKKPRAQKTTALKRAIRSTTNNGIVINTAPSRILKIFSVGEASEGELGLGPDVKQAKRPKLNPYLSPESVGVVQIAVGGMHALALTRDNKIYSWGVNDTGALGRDTKWEGNLADADAPDSDSENAPMNPLESTPTPIPSNHFPDSVLFTQIAAGDSSSFAITDDGRVYGWGTFRDSEGNNGFMLDANHQLVEHQRTPILIPTLDRITQIACGADHAIALDNTGKVFAWGRGEQSQLGRRLLRRRNIKSLIPTRVVIGRKKAAAIGCGSYHSFAIDTEGDVWSWGLNSFGEAGFPVDPDDSSTHVIMVPGRVKSAIGKNIKSVDGGAHHSVGLTSGGECIVWGRADVGQTGLDLSVLPEESVVRDFRGNIRIVANATVVPGNSLDVVSVAAGSDHTVIISKSGIAYACGFNATFQTGLGGGKDEIERVTAVECPSLKDVHLVSAGCGGQFSIFAADL